MENLWLMEKDALGKYLQEFQKISSFNEKEFLAFFSNMPEQKLESKILTIENDKAYIKINGILRSQPLEGFLARYFSNRFTVYQDIINAVNEANSNEYVNDIILQIYSPGGDAGAVDAAYQVIFQARCGKKRVIAENHGIMASGAYWLASAANEIISVSATAMQGSIGVIAVIEDSTQYDEKWGIKKYKIISKNAPAKSIDPKTEAGLKELQSQVDALERVFINRVAQGRNVSEDVVRKNFGKGGLLISKDPGIEKDALDVGMIDSVIISGNKIKKNIISANAKAEQGNKKTIKGGKNMDLNEFFAENPAAKADYEAKIKQAKDEGTTEGLKMAKAVSNSTMVKIASYLESEGYPPDKIKAMSVAVLKGEKTLEAMEATIDMFDMVAETDKIKGAKTETEKIGDTPKDPKETTVSTDGVIKNDNDFAAAVAEAKTAKGLN